MRVLRRPLSPALVGGILGAAMVMASSTPVHAAVALNGTYVAFSDGGLGTRNDVSYGWLYPYPDVTQTWTISTTCHLDACHGTVSSSDGWSAFANQRDGRWWIEYPRPDGIVCADGTFVETRQSFGFDALTLQGTDMMQGPSGACNRNLPIVIKRPFTLTKVQ
ncbi:hypothetical protein ABW16_11720 [Mycolicibacter heraklionensis]|uniref:Secreted protein n=1 Tax=Mycolicibacter heraklionensis TaxID=512402 RepID=A0ABR5FFC4_9MYCO|nr:hypothetical protein [Mycolicibacter heraklionensis]KLO28780.1 hypothetical protein ABW16_11720 [Mycolicibacter heraklionensis]